MLETLEADAENLEYIFAVWNKAKSIITNVAEEHIGRKEWKKIVIGSKKNAHK